VVMGLKTLAMLGKSFPENSTRKHALKSLQQMQKVFVGRSVESLALLPDRTDPLQLIISDISLKTCAAAYYAKPEYVPQLMLMGMRQALQYGNGPTNAASYAFYGVVLLGPSGKIDEAAKFGELALKLLERPKMAIYRCRTTWTVHGLLWPWKKPLNESLAPLAQGYLFGLEMGDLEFAANDAMLHAYYTLYSGLPLAELEVQLSAYCNAIAQMQRPSILNAVKILWQAVQNLRGDGAEPAVLQGDICSAEQMRELLLRSDDRTFMCKLYGTKLMLAYLFGDYEEASQYAMLTERYTDSISGFFGIGVSCFFDALSRLALLPATPFHRRFVAFRKIADNQKKLRQWADHAPSNFLHKWYLVEAEVAHHRGKVTKANRAYDEAIRAARKYNFVHEEAIACERAAEHYLSQGIESVAMAYLQQAQHCYRRWGALAKVRKVAERYPQWLSEQDAVWSASTQTTGPTFATSGGDTRMLDFVAMIRASQALSQEIVLEHLLKRLMNVAVESAGAQRGLLLLKKESDWFIEAEKLEVQHVAAVLHQIISDPSDQLNLRLPISLFHYVINTKKSVVIHDAASDKLAANDDYVQHHQPRSILIVPILRQSEISGMLYLENNSISGAFSERRLEVLHVLASQAAIAIDNAYLYADMEERIAARTVELNAIS
jgi:GAF domain-containing protein